MSLIMPGTGINAGAGFDPFFPIVAPGNGFNGFIDPVLCAVFGINCPTPVPGIPPIEEPGGGFPPGIPRFPQFPSEGGNLICDLFNVGCPPEVANGTPMTDPNGGPTTMPTMPFNGACVTPTSTAAPRAPTVNMFACPNTRGGFDWWGKLGRPLWFSRDNQVVRRGKKLARRLR